MNDSRPKRVLALAAHPERSAATRFRLLRLLPYLRARGLEVTFEPFLREDEFEDFYAEGGGGAKALRLALQTGRRLALSLSAQRIDAVFVQREASLVGPAYTEFILGSIRNIPIIFDFDDAIWLQNLTQSTHPLAARLLKWPGKCWSTMRNARCVIAGSNSLAKQAAAESNRVHVVPTVVSASVWAPLPGRMQGLFGDPHRAVIGWVGSHTTADQLELAAPALRQLRAEGHVFELRIVGARRGFQLEGIEHVAVDWRLSNEISDFQQIDIGLAPMRQGPIYEGKCGFKQLQYMAVGTPFVSSLIGGARDFVVDGENALVAERPDDWYRHLKSLLTSQALRARLAHSGRRLVEARYCAEVQGPILASHVKAALV